MDTKENNNPVQRETEAEDAGDNESKQSQKQIYENASLKEHLYGIRDFDLKSCYCSVREYLQRGGGGGGGEIGGGHENF